MRGRPGWCNDPRKEGGANRSGLGEAQLRAPGASAETVVRDNWVTNVCVCLLLQDILQSCAGGGRRIVEVMCYEIRRAEACVD